MRIRVILVVSLVLVLVTVPYLVAARAAGPDYVFGGFLFNPLDGNSYLAKMWEGWRGDWRFTLPYTAEPGNGAYLFLFYLFLGHLARLLNLSLPLTYHAARVVGTLVLLVALYRFFAITLPAPQPYRLAFALAALGSGFGWVAALFGVFTSDLWVAEAYPFLSAFATPHFSLGLGLLLLMMTLPEDGMKRNAGLAFGLSFLGAAALGILSPFGVVVALVVLGGLALWEAWPSPVAFLRSSAFIRFLAVLSGGVPWLLYDLWVARSDPVLAGWNTQNLTPSPPVWDLVVAMGLVLLLAIPGASHAIRRSSRGERLLLVWAAAGFLLLYLPFGLQRRFMLGLFIPLAGLAALGLKSLASRMQRPRMRTLMAVTLLAVLPTNLLVLFGAWYGIQTHDPLLYLTRGEAQALQWVAQNTPSHALLLASPVTGLFIPAYSGRRVIYGHPFETVNAEAEKAAVTRFFQGQMAPILSRYRVDYVFAGPRERRLGELPPFPGLVVVYASQGVTIYQVERQAAGQRMAP